MNWDPFQREVLAELGLVVYLQAGDGFASTSDAEAVSIDAPGVDVAAMQHSMLAHVARAAGMTSEALQACLDDIQIIASLHGNASAKRALWPRLRTLRRKYS